MLEFKKVTLQDKTWIDPIVMAEGSSSADYNFGNIYIWDKYYRQLVCRCGDRVLTKLRYAGKPMFVFPIGTGPLAPAVEALMEFAAAKGYPFRMRGITEQHRAQLEELFPGRFLFEEDTDCGDYLYEAEKLESFPGKALHSKKNHCNRFRAEHTWSFEPITRQSIPLCLDMLDLWLEDNARRLDASIAREHDAIIRAFAAWEHLGLDGGMLLAEGRVAGFSVGEPAGPDTFDVHFEKADTQMNGAYPMVCSEFVRTLRQKYPTLRYINREDDMGLESLRESKLSYRPVMILKKYTARPAQET